MSYPVFDQARDSLNKAYAAVQNWNTNPAHIPLPNVIHTERRHLTNEQIAARYLKSIEGNPDIDAKKLPKMVSRDRIDHELPITEWEKASNSKKRDFSCTELSMSMVYDKCTSRPYFHFNAFNEMDAAVKVYLYGDPNPDCLCLEELPIFFTCSEKNLQETHDLWMERRQQFLDYRNFSYLQTNEFGKPGVCQPGRHQCPNPETSQMAINRQIDGAIESGLETNIYLNQTMLDDYLTWRRYNGKPENFTYVVVADKPTVASAPSTTGIIASAVGVAVAGAGIIALTVRSVVNYCRQEKKADQPLQEV